MIRQFKARVAVAGYRVQRIEHSVPRLMYGAEKLVSDSPDSCLDPVQASSQQRRDAQPHHQCNLRMTALYHADDIAVNNSLANEPESRNINACGTVV